MIGLANNETPFSGDSLFSLIRKTEIKSNTNHSDFGAQEKILGHCFHFLTFYLP